MGGMRDAHQRPMATQRAGETIPQAFLRGPSERPSLRLRETLVLPCYLADRLVSTLR